MEALILIDPAFLPELSDQILYELDILLDPQGKTELVYDFPEEKWEIVWKRETKEIRKFCEEGKMVIFFLDEDGREVDILGISKVIEVQSGRVILVEADELISCLAYPELEMEVIWETKVEEGKLTFTLNFEQEISLDVNLHT